MKYLIKNKITDYLEHVLLTLAKYRNILKSCRISFAMSSSDERVPLLIESIFVELLSFKLFL